MSHSTPPKILIIAPSAYPLGGVAVWLDYLVKGLEELGWDVKVGLLSGTLHRPESYLEKHPFRQVIQIRSKSQSRRGRVLALISTIRKSSPDIVLSVYCPDTIMSCAQIKKNGHLEFRHVIAVHGLYSDTFEDLKNGCSAIDAVISTNRLGRQLAIKRGHIEPQRAFYAPCGVTLHPRRQISTDKRPLIRIGYIGRLEQNYKHIFDLPRILSILSEKHIRFDFTLAGGGPDKKDLITKLEDSGIPFTDMGVIANEDTGVQFFGNIDVLLMTSLCETGPVVIWEAWSYGVAVVSSQYLGSGLEQALFDEFNALLFPVGDVHTAADQLCRLSEHDDLLKTLIENGYNTLNSRYSSDASATQWELCLKRILQCDSKKYSELFDVHIQDTGKLQVLGPFLSEWLRRILPKKKVKDPGDEWPHSYSANRFDEDYWQELRTLDTTTVTASETTTRKNNVDA